MLGLAKADGGIIELFGKPITEIMAEDRQNIGVSLAESGFNGQFTIVEVEKILAKMYPKFEESWFTRECQKLHLPEGKQFKEFSNGMKAKLRVLTALSHKAQLLILDEPTAGLDVEARNEILDLLREYAAEDESRTILITSHIASDLEHLCDDIYLIHGGKQLLHEETDVILEQYGLIKADEAQYAALDKEYLLDTQKEPYGYACLTNDRKYYEENVPDLVVERAGIDDVILMMTGGEKDEWIIRERYLSAVKRPSQHDDPFLMICVFLGLSQTGTFILGYFPFLMIVLLIGTLSCDEADNGLPFLFTLPIDRKLYIREKYLFCVAGTVVSFVLAWALYLVSLLVHGVSNVSGVLSENAGMIPVFLAVFFITISIMIPVQIKCGAESARVMMAGICFLFAGVILFVQKVAGEATLDQITELIGTITGTIPGQAGIFTAGIVVLLISYRISVGFMEKQEF